LSLLLSFVHDVSHFTPNPCRFIQAPRLRPYSTKPPVVNISYTAASIGGITTLHNPLRVVASSTASVAIRRLLEYSLLSISVPDFCSKVVNCWNLWKPGASRFHLSNCRPGNRSECIRVEGCLFKALTLRAPGTLTHHSVLRHWQLVFKYIRY